MVWSEQSGIRLRIDACLCGTLRISSHRSPGPSAGHQLRPQTRPGVRRSLHGRTLH